MCSLLRNNVFTIKEIAAVCSGKKSSLRFSAGGATIKRSRIILVYDIREQ